MGYLLGSEGYAHGSGSPDPHTGKHDMWQDEGPGTEAVKHMYYSANYYAQTGVDIIRKHGELLAQTGSQQRLFMYFAIQSEFFDRLTALDSRMLHLDVHSPYTLPPSWETKDYPEMWDHTYANMLAMLDSAVANLTDAVKDAGSGNSCSSSC